MAKRIARGGSWLKAPSVEDVLAVSGCISEDFADYVTYWRHNGYWFFDSPEQIRELARAHALDLSGCAFFYYEPATNLRRRSARGAPSVLRSASPYGSSFRR